MIIDKYKSGSTGNLYKISDSRTSILMECGLSIKKIGELTNFSYMDCAGCLLTHEHSDHSKSAKDLLNLGLNVYMSLGTAESLKLENHWNACLMIPEKQYSIGTFIVKGFVVNHDAKEPFGYFIYSTVTKERLLFVTDTYWIEPVFPKLNYLMIECSFDEEVLKNNEVNSYYAKRLVVSHMSIRMVLDYVKKIDISVLKGIHLLHLSDKSSKEDEFIRKIQAVSGVPVYV